MKQYFKYEKGSDTIRLMPENYCILSQVEESHGHPTIFIDHAVETKIYARVIDCIKVKSNIGIRWGKDWEEKLNNHLRLKALK